MYSNFLSILSSLRVSDAEFLLFLFEFVVCGVVVTDELEFCLPDALFFITDAHAPNFLGSFWDVLGAAELGVEFSPLAGVFDFACCCDVAAAAATDLEFFVPDDVFLDAIANTFFCFSVPHFLLYTTMLLQSMLSILPLLSATARSFST